MRKKLSTTSTFILMILMLFLPTFEAAANNENHPEELITCNLNITTTGNSISVGALNGSHVIFKLFNPDWTTNFACTDNCGNLS